MGDLQVLGQHAHGGQHDCLGIAGLDHGAADGIQHRQALSHTHRGRGFGHRVEHPHDLAELIAHRAVAKSEVSQLWPLTALNHQGEVFDIGGLPGKRCIGNGTDFAPGFFPDFIERPPQGFRLVAQNGHKCIVVQGD